jgi:transglutaminase-like putative cysteine protease
MSARRHRPALTSLGAVAGDQPRRPGRPTWPEHGRLGTGSSRRADRARSRSEPRLLPRSDARWLTGGAPVADYMPGERTVSVHMTATLEDAALVALQIAPSAGYQADELLELTIDGRGLAVRELNAPHGARIHAADVPAGELTIAYRAQVSGAGTPDVADEVDLLHYLRPSRYCESDTLTPMARAQFGTMEGARLLAAVNAWVGTRLSYVPGSSLPTDGAVQTMLGRRGVCRDYAHLVVALLRALDVPARVAGVYAPGLRPMDFHAVAEAYVNGAWHVVDATCLAPRASFVRIATGADASDIAFLSNYGGALTLREMEVTALVDELPGDDIHRMVQIR